MSEYIPAEVVESRFRENEKRLDAALASCRSVLATRGLEVSEHSNRSGFEKSGFPYFVWCHQFTQEVRSGAFVERAMVEITFQQPGTSGTRENVSCARTAERFWIGSNGPRMAASLQIPLAELFTNSSLGDLVKEQMDLAQQEFLLLRGNS